MILKSLVMLLGSQIGIAFILDLIFGDPKGFPHPVKGIGRVSLLIERVTRRIFKNQFLAGIICVGIVVACVYFFCAALLRVCSGMSESLEIAVSVFLIYTTLSIKSLYMESKVVKSNLASGQIANGRKSLSGIVGRDTHNMNPVEMTRACIETVSENTADGIVAPLFYAFIGGAPLAMAYKAINTLDSMFGYQSKEYREFGWAAAKLDDLVNWIPARVTGIFMVLSALFLRFDAKSALSIMMRDGRKHPSPNAGIPEAAMAGALRIQLGGPSVYKGVLHEKPWIGNPQKLPSLEDIANTHKAMFLTSFLVFCFFELLFVLTGVFY